MPLIKEQRRKINSYTYLLNNKIKGIVRNYKPPSGGKITYVEPEQFFEGHRFCEEGVKEPSYRNKKIYFYPFEFWTGGTYTLDASANQG